MESMIKELWEIKGIMDICNISVNIEFNQNITLNIEMKGGNENLMSGYMLDQIIDIIKTYKKIYYICFQTQQIVISSPYFNKK